MKKILTLDFISDEDEYGCSTSEEIHGVSENGTRVDYCVHDLWECPEDAILGRDLFSAWEYIETIQLGMRLAQEGYSDIEINNISEKEYYDEDEDKI